LTVAPDFPAAFKAPTIRSFNGAPDNRPFALAPAGLITRCFSFLVFHRAFIAAAELSLFFLRRAGALVSEGRRPTMPSSSDEQLAMRVRRFLYERRVAFEGNKP